MSTNLLGNDVASMVEYAYNRGHYPRFARKFFKIGDVAGLAGAINITYGALVYDHVNREANAHAIIKKENWERSGFRVVPNAATGTTIPTGDPATKGYAGANPGQVGVDGSSTGTNTGGTATMIDMSPQTLASIPGFLHTPFDMTMDAGFRAQHDDGLDVWEWKLAIMRDVHAQLLNTKLLKDAQAKSNAFAGTSLTGTTGAALNDAKNATTGSQTPDAIESLDRLIASSAEATQATNSGVGSGTGHYNVYEGRIQRTGTLVNQNALTDYDAWVIRPDGTQTAFGTVLPFQIAGMDSAIDNTENNGADATAQVFLTRRDTRRAFYDEVNTFGRYDLTLVQAKLDMAGLSQSATHPGRDITFTVRAYQDRPLVVDKNVTSNYLSAAYTGKGHMYLLDQRHVHLKVGFPTLYVDVDNPVIRGQFDTRALYLTCEQTYMTRFNTSAKIRSIQ